MLLATMCTLYLRATNKVREKTLQDFDVLEPTWLVIRLRERQEKNKAYLVLYIYYNDSFE